MGNSSDKTSRIESAVNALRTRDLEERSARKRIRLRETSKRKKVDLDPNSFTFDRNLHEVMDGDTFRNRRTGQVFRASGGDPYYKGEGYATDTFETGLDPYGNENNYYEKNPDKGYCQVVISPKIEKVKKLLKSQ